MASSELLVYGARDGEALAIASDESIVCSSSSARWSGVYLEEQRLPPTELPDSYMAWHLLSVQLTPPKTFEWREGAAWQRSRLGGGDVFFVPAGVPGRSRWFEPSLVLNLGLDPAFVASVAEERFGTARVELPGRSAGPDPKAFHLVSALRAELESASPNGRLFVETVASALAIHLVCAHLPASPKRGRSTGRLPTKELKMLEEYVRAHLTDDLSLADLAKIVGLSPWHFARAFKATTGDSPHRYFLRCRVGEAERLLTTGRASVEQAAHLTGFVDRSHLARNFRKFLGCSPKDVRRRRTRILV